MLSIADTTCVLQTRRDNMWERGQLKSQSIVSCPFEQQNLGPSDMAQLLLRSDVSHATSFAKQRTAALTPGSTWWPEAKKTSVLLSPIWSIHVDNMHAVYDYKTASTVTYSVYRILDCFLNSGVSPRFQILSLSCL